MKIGTSLGRCVAMAAFLALLQVGAARATVIDSGTLEYNGFDWYQYGGLPSGYYQFKTTADITAGEVSGGYLATEFGYAGFNTLYGDDNMFTYVPIPLEFTLHTISWYMSKPDDFAIHHDGCYVDDWPWSCGWNEVGYYDVAIFGMNIIFSPGFQGKSWELINSDEPFSRTAVPEPAAWAEMILGFACIGSLLRRRSLERRPASA